MDINQLVYELCPMFLGQCILIFVLMYFHELRIQKAYLLSLCGLQLNIILRVAILWIGKNFIEPHNK